MSDPQTVAVLGAGSWGSAFARVLGTSTSPEGARSRDVVIWSRRPEVAEAVNPTEYTDHFQRTYETAPYYSAGRQWNDYEPAYRYGYDTYGEYRGQRFEDVESTLERNWDSAKADSRLAWAEAKSAVRDGWHHIERKLPGDADRDGR